LKTPYRDGTTHIVLEPLDFIARLPALVPPLRVHLTRFHGVFAAHAALRAAITPAGRGTGTQKRSAGPERPRPKDIRMNWARRLKRVFGIEIEQCVRCGGRLKVIASIEELEVIERILAHRRERGEEGRRRLRLEHEHRHKRRCSNAVGRRRVRVLARAAGGAARGEARAPIGSAAALKVRCEKRCEADSAP
jgi:hypothetical protein